MWVWWECLGGGGHRDIDAGTGDTRERASPFRLMPRVARTDDRCVTSALGKVPGFAQNHGMVGSRGDPIFATTHWSVVLTAREGARETSAVTARDALEALCRTYWRPVFACIRSRAKDIGDAEDLTQEFFYRLLDGHYLTQIDPAKGRFRSFLLVAIRHFLSNARDHVRAVKRGGRVHFVSLEQFAEEARLELEPRSSESPDRAFERRWAMTFLATVLERLRAECAEEGDSGLFEVLKPFLTGNRPGTSYVDLSQRLGLTEGALKMRVSRLRSRYAQLAREEVARTVSGPDEVADELRHLLEIVSS